MRITKKVKSYILSIVIAVILLIAGKLGLIKDSSIDTPEINKTSKSASSSNSSGYVTPLKSDSTTNLFIKKFINKKRCDRVLSNAVVETCYDDKLKSATVVSYLLDGTKVYVKDIEKRPSWKYNKDIPKKYRSNNNDYLKTGYDKFHLAFDSGYDYDARVLKNTYDLNINAVAGAANVNRYTWIKSEAYAKKVAKDMGKANVIDIIEFSKNPKKIGRNQISVPSGFYKMIYNIDKKFQKCFYYKNDLKVKVKGDKLKSHIIDCSVITNIVR